MADIEMDAPGKFSELEEQVLKYLYEHPDNEVGTVVLMRALRPEQHEGEKEHEAYKETQYAIETLIAARLADGEPHSGFGPGNIYHNELKLTKKGMAEAINQRRRAAKIVIKNNIPRPNRDTF